MNDDMEKRAREIEADIARTRAQMDATLSAIESRLTPGQLLDQGMDYLRNSGGNEFVSNLGATVRRNPVPVTLAGIGIAWLMAANRGGSAAADLRHDDIVFGESPSPGVRERAAEAAHKVSDSMRTAGDTVSRAAESARDTAAYMAESARQRARELKYGAKQQVERARSGYDTLLREQPLALGVIGLAIGAVVAAALPRTRAEERLTRPERRQRADAGWDGHEDAGMPDDGTGDYETVDAGIRASPVTTADAMQPSPPRQDQLPETGPNRAP